MTDASQRPLEPQAYVSLRAAGIRREARLKR